VISTGALGKNVMKQIKRGLKLGLLISLSLIILPFCYACGGGGSGNTILSVVQGEALVKKAGVGDWVKGEEKMVLKVGDSIKSGTGGNAVITFFDGSTIEIKAETQIEIAELVKGKTKIIRLKQEIGETLSKVEKLADAASRYEIETPVAVAGVRGSQMKVTVAANGVTVVQNIEGKISVRAQGVEVMIPVGGIGSVKSGEPPILELSYDDGNPDGGYSTGGVQKNGFLVRFELPAAPFTITRVKIFSWIKGTPNESDQFTVRITDKDLTPFWEISLPFTLFTTDHSWLEVEVPNIIVNDDFCILLYAPSLGQGLGPYIGIDRSGINEHSELLSDWQITSWTIQIPKEESNWMIRVNGNAE
jgi:hypothetical protein